MSKLYKIVSSQLVYSYAYVEADNEQDAYEAAHELSGELDWKEFQYGDWELEDAQLVKKEA